jgi:hypothetical protein
VIDGLTKASLAVLGVFSAALSWLITGKLVGYDSKLASHSTDIASLEVRIAMAEQQMVDHRREDHRQFGEIRQALLTISEDVKQLIRELPKK